MDLTYTYINPQKDTKSIKGKRLITHFHPISILDVLNTSCTPRNHLTPSVIRVCYPSLTVIVRGTRPNARNHVSLQRLVADVLLLHQQNSPAGLGVHFRLGFRQAIFDGLGTSPSDHDINVAGFDRIQG